MIAEIANAGTAGSQNAAARIVQVEFDWTIGHARPWITADEARRALDCSDDHILNLFDEGAIDVVIDIKSDGAKRPCYRIFRDSFFRYVNRVSPARARAVRVACQTSDSDFEKLLLGYLNCGPSVLRSWQAALHFGCSEDHILDLAPEFTDISRPNATRAYLRVTRTQIVEFAKRRKVT